MFIKYIPKSKIGCCSFCVFKISAATAKLPFKTFVQIYSSTIVDAQIFFFFLTEGILPKQLIDNHVP